MNDSTLDKNRRIRDLMSLLSPNGYIVLWVEEGEPRLSKSGLNDSELVGTLLTTIGLISSGRATHVEVTPETN